MLSIDLGHDRAGPATTAPDGPAVVGRAEGLPDDAGDGDAVPAESGGPARVLRIQADVQQLHGLIVKTRRIYVKLRPPR
jgi:hypothetical protein